MSIPEEQGKVLDGLAASGDESAKAWASELGREPQPAPTGDAKEKASDAADTKPADDAVKAEAKAEAKPAESSEEGSGVDANRDGAGGGDKKPSIYAEVRRLKQERRQLRNERDESRRREEALNSRLAALEAQSKNVPDGSKSKSAEEDILAQLLTDPNAVFADRDKRLVQAVREALKHDLSALRQAEERRSEKSSAIKTLESIKDLDLERDEDKVFELMEETYGFTEEEVEELLASKPTRTAGMIKRAWEKKYSTALPDNVKADKASARVVAVGGGGQSHAKSTLSDLNSRARGARTKEDLDRLWEEAGKLS